MSNQINPRRVRQARESNGLSEEEWPDYLMPDELEMFARLTKLPVSFFRKPDDAEDEQ